MHIDAAATAKVEEAWELRSKDGDSIQIQIHYARGAMTSGKGEQMMYSAAKPEFYRIYRSEQATDVVRGGGIDRVEKLVLKATGEKIAPLFDGSEQLIGVISNPWYSRQTYLPGS